MSLVWSLKEKRDQVLSGKLLKRRFFVLFFIISVLMLTRTIIYIPFPYHFRMVTKIRTNGKIKHSWEIIISITETWLYQAVDKWSNGDMRLPTWTKFFPVDSFLDPFLLLLILVSLVLVGFVFGLLSWFFGWCSFLQFWFFTGSFGWTVCGFFRLFVHSLWLVFWFFKLCVPENLMG